jgi:hypothetical protein
MLSCFQATSAIVMRVRLSSAVVGRSKNEESNGVRSFQTQFFQSNENRLSLKECPGSEQLSTLRKMEISDESIRFQCQHQREMVVHQHVVC